MTIRVILDSNFLMVPPQFQIDIFEELERLLNKKVETVIPSPVYEEIREISVGKHPKQSRQAKVAMEVAERSKILRMKLQPKETTDDLIARLAKDWRCPVATNDADLRKRLRNMNVPVIYLRQRSHLEIEGAIPLDADRLERFKART